VKLRSVSIFGSYVVLVGAILANEPSVVRVTLNGPGALQRLQTHSFDIVTVHPIDPTGPEMAPPAADLVVDRDGVDLLVRLGFRPRAATQPAPRDTPPSKVAGGFPPGFGQGVMGGMYTLAEIEGLLDQYAANHPAIVTPKFSIGTSVEGRPIWAVRVSDQPGVAEGEPTVLFDALHHAREPMSAHCLLVLLERLAIGYGVDPEITTIVDERDLWLVPVVNPDGYVHNESTQPNGGGMWRKNRRAFGGGCVGVDLNRNYAFQWGIDDVGSSPDACTEVYRGPAPLSEPESAAMAALASSVSFDVVASLHAHGGLYLRPFGHAPATPAQESLYLEHESRLEATNGYRAGDIISMVGFANGNALDHHEGQHGSEAWGFEVGASFWPNSTEMIDVANENIAPLMSLLRWAGSTVEATRFDVDDAAHDQDGFADPGETIDLDVVLHNAGRDTSSAIVVQVTSPDPNVVVVHSGGTSGALASLTDGVATGVRVSIAAAAEPGARVPLSATVQHDGVETTRSLVLDLGTPRVVVREDFETDKGWTAGVPGDTALTGVWTLADPTGVMHGPEPAQPEDDTTASPGTRCYVTGNQGSAPGYDDVDSGTTTLISPRIDLTGAENPRLRFRRFYWCSKLDDPFVVDVSNDDGASWAPLEVFEGSANAWATIEWPIAPVKTPTAAMRFRFVATDPLNTSVTEALIDDVEIVGYGVDPHVAVLGRPALGGSLELQVAAQPTNRVLVFAAAGASSLTVAGVVGTLELDPTSLVVVIDATAPGTGLMRAPVSVPTDPILSGRSVHLQALEVGATALVLSNATVLTIE